MNRSNPTHLDISVKLYREQDRLEENLLVVSDGEHHHKFGKTARDGEPHVITWTLTGNASDGEFCALDDAQYPGFSWLFRQPDASIFSNLRAEGKHKISLHNHHHDERSEGCWHYQLFARFGGKIYGVPITFGCGHSSNPNPTIKNT